MHIYNQKIDFFFIKFPIFFPLIYLLLLFIFPSYENILIISVILLLAEPHFAATYPILFDSSNKDFLFKKRAIFYLGSALVICYCLVGFFLFTSFFFLSFYAFNMFHVARQSVGVCKFYNLQQDDIKLQISLIYIFNILFFFIGFLRFYINQIPQEILLELNLLILLLIICVIIFYIKKYKLSENVFTLITGIIIFYPICFVSNPIHAILLGVTMHYSQYLLITYKVYRGRKNLFNVSSKINFANLFKNKFLYIVLSYAVIMTLFSLSSKSANIFFQKLILIPIIGQTLHFYLDSFIWKFSEEHNRNNTLKFIKQRIL